MHNPLSLIDRQPVDRFQPDAVGQQVRGTGPYRAYVGVIDTLEPDYWGHPGAWVKWLTHEGHPIPESERIWLGSHFLLDDLVRAKQ
jgi:hypothetical protein